VVEELAGAAAADVRAVAGVLAPLAACNAGLIAAIALVLTLLARRAGRNAVVVDTWGCGYAAPDPRMQYTAASFAEMGSGGLVPGCWRRRGARRPPEGTSPRSAGFASDVTDPLTRGAYEPLLSRWGHRFARLRFLQQGSLHMYLVYILAMAVLGLAWVGARRWWFP